MQSVRDLFEARRASAYPAELSEAAEIGGVALVMLDADIDGLAETYLASTARSGPTSGSRCASASSTRAPCCRS
jgi:hypothetical protein